MKNKTIAIIISGFLFVMLCIFVYLNFFYVIDVQEVYMEMKVSELIGLNVNNSAIYFGKVMRGTTAERDVNFTNYYNFPVKVEINSGGNISEFVSVSENSFVLAPGEEKNIVYYAKPLDDTPLATYTGITRVIYKRALFS